MFIQLTEMSLVYSVIQISPRISVLIVTLLTKFIEYRISHVVLKFGLERNV